MVKTKSVNTDDWRHRDSKFCRDCNCSVGSSQWLNHLSKQSHVDSARVRILDNAAYRQNLLNMQAMNVAVPIFRLNGPATIIDQFISFKSQVMMKPEDCTRIETAILKDLQPLLVKTFGIFQVHTFGSMQTGLALIGSDVDVSIATGNLQYQTNNVLYQYEARRKVQQCSDALRCDSNFTDVNPTLDAKVPVVSVLHLPTRTKCDISFSGSFGKEQGQLLSYYFNLHPRFLEVMQVIKFWAKKHGICDGRNFISAYGWSLLFVGYLQTLKLANGSLVAPPVYKMQLPWSRNPKIVQGCRVDLTPPHHSVDLPDTPEYSHLGLLNGFFHFANFSFRDFVLCPYLGIKVPRYSTPPGLIDPGLMMHVNYLQADVSKSRTARYLRIIQDTFNHRSYLYCSSMSLPRITACISSAGRLCEATRQSNPDFHSVFLESLFSC